MKLLEVVPIISNILGSETFSYFTAKDINEGALVLVPFKKKNIPALVLKASEVEQSKFALRKADYPLRSMKAVLAPYFLTKEFLESSRKIAAYYASPLGPILKTVLAQRVIQKGLFLNDIAESIDKSTKNRYSKTLCQGEWPERCAYYKSIIREEFARGSSVFFCLPTINDAKAVFEEMRKGIEDYALLIHGDLKAKEFDNAWKKTLDKTHSLLIMGTGFIFSVPRRNIGAIIVERESSAHYKTQNRPFIDFRKLAEFLSDEMKNRLIVGGDTLRTETYWRKLNGEFETVLASPARIRSEAKGIIVSLVKTDSDFLETNPKKHVDFPGFISEELKTLIKEARSSGEKTFLFINRRGHSPSTICLDCSKTILCPRCEAPLVLHKGIGGKNRSMLCHHCLFSSSAPAECPYCKSWKLESFGIGIQKAAEELAGLFPDVHFIRVDSDAVKNKKQIPFLLKKFFAESNSILIGTELVFPYLTSPVDNVAVISIDGLFTIPDFRINERIFAFLIFLRSIAAKKFLVQTRMLDQEVFGYAIKGDTTGFYQQELEMRSKLKYPPFAKFIKITRESKDKNALREEISVLKETVKKYHPLEFPSFIEKVKDRFRRNLVLRVEPMGWPEKYPELILILKSLNFQWRVEIDPESLL